MNVEPSRAVYMTRTEAEAIYEALNKGRVTVVSQMRKIDRKRTMTGPQKLHENNERRRQLDAYQAAQKLIGTAFNIGGY